MGTPDDRASTPGLPRHPHREGATNVLLLAPDGTDADSEACLHLLSDDDVDLWNVLSLGYSTPPARTARAVGRATDSTMDAAFVCIGERTRSTATASTSSEIDAWPGATTVQVVPDPTDLAGIGLAVNERLEGWGDDGQTVVCYHSLTHLLDYVDLQTAFRFLHVLLGRIAAADARAHFHLDPERHDRETVGTLSLLFDDVVSVDEDGD